MSQSGRQGADRDMVEEKCPEQQTLSRHRIWNLYNKNKSFIK